jgi:hypothetical protein
MAGVKKLWRIVRTVDQADEVPTELASAGAILVGSARMPKWLAFDCPCLTGHRIMVPLDSSQDPHWTVTDADPLSVWPSFDYRSPARRCHFVLARGRVLWVQDRKQRR